MSITGTYTHLCAANSDTTRQMSVFQGVLDDNGTPLLYAGVATAGDAVWGVWP